MGPNNESELAEMYLNETAHSSEDADKVHFFSSAEIVLLRPDGKHGAGIPLDCGLERVSVNKPSNRLPHRESLILGFSSLTRWYCNFRAIHLDVVIIVR